MDFKGCDTSVTMAIRTGQQSFDCLSFNRLKLDASKAERSKPAACWLHCCPEAHGARQECAGSLWLTFYHAPLRLEMA